MPMCMVRESDLESSAHWLVDVVSKMILLGCREFKICREFPCTLYQCNILCGVFR